MRLLRDEGGCAVVFVHHTGHEGTHLRGSSDLESYWESRITLERKEDADEATFSSAHREAESSATQRFRLAWDVETRSVRLRLTEDEQQLEIVQKVADYLDKHPNASANEIATALGGNRQKVLRAVAHLRDEEVVPDIPEPPGTTPAAKAPMVSPEEGGLRSTPSDRNHRASEWFRDRGDERVSRARAPPPRRAVTGRYRSNPGRRRR
jgi:hypothetical protein